MAIKVFILIVQHRTTVDLYMKATSNSRPILSYTCASLYFGILQENTLKRLQGNMIKTIMGICKNCRAKPLLKALNLSHIPSIV